MGVGLSRIGLGRRGEGGRGLTEPSLVEQTATGGDEIPRGGGRRGGGILGSRVPPPVRTLREDHDPRDDEHRHEDAQGGLQTAHGGVHSGEGRGARLRATTLVS